MATTCGVFEAVVTAVLRLPTRLEFDSSRRMLHIGQTDDTACRSRSISLAQPASATGSELPPVWFVLVKHGALAELVRLVVVASEQLWIGGSPTSLRNRDMLANAFGSS